MRKKIIVLGFLLLNSVISMNSVARGQKRAISKSSNASTIMIDLIPNHNIQPSLSAKSDNPNSFLLIYDLPASNDGVVLNFVITGSYNGTPVKELARDLKFSISQLVPNQNYILETTEHPVNSNEYKVCPTTLTVNGESLEVNCPGFRPIVKKFKFTAQLKKEGTDISNQSFNLNVNNTLTQVILDNNAATPTTYPNSGCGLTGTARQRMFDCSMRVINFGYEVVRGTTTSIGTVKPYIEGASQVDSDWFLMECPVYSSSIASYNCAWLAPVMKKEDPALIAGEFDTGRVNTNTRNGETPLAMSTYASQRFLWSGLLSDTYTFYDANTGSLSNVPGWFDQYNSDSPQGPETRSIVGTHEMFALGACQTQQFVGRELSQHWQVPSYPMFYTLTGGSISGCNPYGSDPYRDSYRCSNKFGFNVALIPGFNFSDTDKHTNLWSSSFFGLTGAIQNFWMFQVWSGSGILFYPNQQYIRTGVRCVTSEW